MLPGDRLVCAFVVPQAVGSEFRHWLLHVTVVPWFRLSESSEKIAEGLSKPLRAVESFEAPVGGEVLFGPQKNRPANLLAPSSFDEIEPKVRKYLRKKRAWLVDETTKVRRPFRPHVTFQADQRLHQGDVIYCDRLYIVEQKGDYKSVVAEINFG